MTANESDVDKRLLAIEAQLSEVKEGAIRDSERRMIRAKACGFFCGVVGSAVFFSCFVMLVYVMNKIV